MNIAFKIVLTVPVRCRWPRTRQRRCPGSISACLLVIAQRRASERTERAFWASSLMIALAGCLMLATSRRRPAKRPALTFAERPFEAFWAGRGLALRISP